MPAELAAVNRRLPRPAAFSGRTAAWLHGLDLELCKPIEVTLPMDSRTSRLASVAVTRSNFLESEISTVRDLRVTSIIRTVADVARHLSVIEATAVFDMALHRRKVTAGQLRQWIASHAGYRGIGTLRQAIELIEPATESPMETRLRLLLAFGGLPRPKVQVALYDEDESRARICSTQANGSPIEYDGATHRESVAGDNRRQNRLIDAGFRVLRFTAGDVLNTPIAVVGLVRRALAS
jgi:hypothetical protein